MELPHIVEDTHVILRSRGVYKQAKVYRRGENVFANYGSGFIRLTRNGGTSAPNVVWIDMEEHDSISFKRTNNPRWDEK